MKKKHVYTLIFRRRRSSGGTKVFRRVPKLTAIKLLIRYIPKMEDICITRETIEIPTRKNYKPYNEAERLS